MVVGRKDSLARAADLVRSGISVDVVGGRGSGRTAFLNALRQRLIEDDWTVITIRGIASLRHHPLASLHLAGIGGGARPGGNLQDTSAALRAKLHQDRSVLFLDDWDDLDESSWGIAESARRMEGIPVVLSRLQGLRARHTPSGLDASTIEPSYVIDMTPLRFEEMEIALADYLQAPLESSTVSRIYAKTGGNIGLAVSLVDATTREGQLVLSDGQWVAHRDLWSTGLRAVLEAYLENLDGDTRDALEIIAIAGLASIDTVRKLVDWGTLELLEERAMVTIIESGSPQLVAVIPPLLVEYFRHEPLSARRIRLTELIMDRLGAAESAAAILTEHHYRPKGTPEREALFVRLLHERARALRIVTAAEWETSRTPSNAVRYVEALSHTFSPTVDGAVRRVLSQTEPATADTADKAQLYALKARWYAYVDQDLTLAIQHLSEHRVGLGAHARILDAAEVEIRFNLESLPEDFAEKLEITDDLPDDVKVELLGTQLFVLVCGARLVDAQRVYDMIQKHGPPSNMARVLHAMVLLGSGQFQAALELLTRGLDEAHSYLDVEGVRIFGAAAIMCHIFSGDNSGLDELIETIFAAGDPTPFPAGNQLALLSIGALTAIRKGNIATGERLIADIERLKFSDGPLPGQSHAWAHAQLLIINGRSSDAATLLWNSSRRLWDRGARFAALTGLLAAIEIEPTQQRLADVKVLLGEVDGLVVFHAQWNYYHASLNHDIENMLEAAAELQASGRVGLAGRAYQHAAALAAESNDNETANLAQLKLEHFRNRHLSIDIARFSANVVSLSDREKEVAILASEGFSNQEIANRLVLSVRTVETHMHRILRKLDISSRRAITPKLAGMV